MSCELRVVRRARFARGCALHGIKRFGNKMLPTQKGCASHGVWGSYKL